MVKNRLISYQDSWVVSRPVTGYITETIIFGKLGWHMVLILASCCIYVLIGIIVCCKTNGNGNSLPSSSFPAPFFLFNFPNFQFQPISAPIPGCSSQCPSSSASTCSATWSTSPSSTWWSATSGAIAFWSGASPSCAVSSSILVPHQMRPFSIGQGISIGKHGKLK